MSAVAACLAYGWVASAHADDRLQFHGFISQTAIYTDGNTIGDGSKDDLSLDMREIGVNASYRPNGDWLLSGQLLSRKAGNTDDGDLRVDYAFVDRIVYAGQENGYGVQVGKVKNPYGLYNITRDVAHTRPGIIMPQSIYLDRVRNFFLAAPGVSLYGSHNRGAWDTTWRVNAVRPETDGEDLEHLFFLRNMPGRYKGKWSWLGQVMTEMDGGRLRMGLTLGQVATEYRPARNPPLDFLSGEQELRPRLLSLEWNEENWSLTGEYEQVKNSGKNYGLGGAGPEEPNTVEAWYLQGTYRLSPSLRVYLRRDVSYFDKDDKSGSRFAAANPPFPAHLVYSREWVLGVRQDWKNWAFSAEVHDIEGTGWLSPLDTPILPPSPPPEKDWRMILLQAAYRF